MQTVSRSKSRQCLPFLGLILLCSVLMACGFQLRGIANLSFQKVHIQGAKLTISRELEQAFKVNGVQVVSAAENAEMVLDLMSESNQKNILSLSGGGLVREFELLYVVNFRTRAASDTLYGNPQSVQLRRDLSYNDDALLGKLEEEQRLNQDMRKDAVREIIRRLSAISSQ